MTGGALNSDTSPLRAEEILLIAFLLAFPFDAVLTSLTGSTVSSEGITLTRLLVVPLLGVILVRTLWTRDTWLLTAALSNPVSVLILCYLLVILLSGVTARSISGPMGSFIRHVGLFMVYFVVFTVVRNRRILFLAAVAFVVSAVPSVLAGLYEIITGAPVIPEIRVTEGFSVDGLYAERSGTVRVRGLAVDPVRHSFQLLLQLGLLLAFLSSPRTRKARWPWILLLLLILVNVLSTGARSGWAAFLVLCGVFFFLIPLRHKRALIVGGIAGFAGAFLVLIVVFPHLAIQDRMVLGSHVTSGAREALARLTIEIVKENPLLGIGAGNFSSEASRYLWATHDLLYAAQPLPHNVYLGALAETGIVGFVVYAAWHIALLLQIVWSIRNSSDPPVLALAIGLLSSYSAYLFMIQFNPAWTDKYFWAMMGLSAALARILRQERALQASPSVGVAR